MNTHKEVKSNASGLFQEVGLAASSFAMMLFGLLGVFLLFYITTAYAFITVPALLVVNACMYLFGGPVLSFWHLIQVGYALAFFVAITRWITR